MHETLRRTETITHLSTNRAQRNTTSPVNNSALPHRQGATLKDLYWCIDYSSCP